MSRNTSRALSTSGITARSASATYIAGRTITNSVVRISDRIGRAADIPRDVRQAIAPRPIANNAAASDRPSEIGRQREAG